VTRAAIYRDTSVALAHLLAADRAPPASLWREVLISSRLLEYEIWTRIDARRLGNSHGDEVRALASYDDRLIDVARAMKFAIHDA